MRRRELSSQAPCPPRHNPRVAQSLKQNQAGSTAALELFDASTPVAPMLFSSLFAADAYRHVDRGDTESSDSSGSSSMRDVQEVDQP